MVTTNLNQTNESERNACRTYTRNVRHYVHADAIMEEKVGTEWITTPPSLIPLTEPFKKSTPNSIKRNLF